MTVFPVCQNWRKKECSLDRKQLKLYLVTDTHALRGRDFFDVVEAALMGGVTMVQLREKTLPTADFLKKANALRTMTERYGVPLIINDRLDIAFDSKACGLHVGQKDISASDSRRILRKDTGKILGVTANTIAQAQAAEAAGADYIGAGAMFATQTKGDTTPLSKEALKAIVESISIPVVAIGGINAQNAKELTGLGLAGLAISSGIMGAENVYETAKALAALKL